MSGIPEIRVALATALENIPDLSESLGGYRTSPYPLSNPTPPVIEIANFAIVYHAAMGRISTQARWYSCIVRAYVAMASQDGAQMKADMFMESETLAQAIEEGGSGGTADATLGGLCDALIVDRADARFWDHPTLTSLIVGAEWQVRIFV